MMTLRGTGNQAPAQEQTRMEWTAADTLEATIPLQGAETALSAVEVPGAGRVALALVTLPYSPEYKPVEADAGGVTLARLAQATGGRERLQLADVWRDLPRRIRLIELAPYLLLLAVVLLLLEVLERHTGLVTPIVREWRWLLHWQHKPKQITPINNLSAVTPQPFPVTPPETGTQQPAPEVPPQLQPTAIHEVLKQARQQAQEKTKR